MRPGTTQQTVATAQLNGMGKNNNYTSDPINDVPTGRRSTNLTCQQLTIYCVADGADHV